MSSKSNGQLIPDFTQGNTVKFTVPFLDDKTVPDISGDTVRAIIKKSKSDPDSAALLDVTGDVVSLGASGKAVFKFKTADTKAVEPGDWHGEIVWDVNNVDNDRWTFPRPNEEAPKVHVGSGVADVPA